MTGSMLCAILDSMLSYSQRMTDINKQRGIAAEGDIELPLLIKATHLPHPTRINRYEKTSVCELGIVFLSAPNN